MDQYEDKTLLEETSYGFLKVYTQLTEVWEHITEVNVAFLENSLDTKSCTELSMRCFGNPWLQKNVVRNFTYT